MRFEICKNFVVKVENNSLLYDGKVFDVNKISFVGYHEHGFYINNTSNNYVLNHMYECDKELYRFIECINLHIAENYKHKMNSNIIIDFIDTKYDVIFHENNEYYISILDDRNRKFVTSIELLLFAHNKNKHVSIKSMHIDDRFVRVNGKNENDITFECFNEDSMAKIKEIIKKVGT